MLDQIGDGRSWQTAVLDFPLGRGIKYEIEVDSIQLLLTPLWEIDIQLFCRPKKNGIAWTTMNRATANTWCKTPTAIYYASPNL